MKNNKGIVTIQQEYIRCSSTIWLKTSITPKVLLLSYVRFSFLVNCKEVSKIKKKKITGLPLTHFLCQPHPTHFLSFFFFAVKFPEIVVPVYFLPFLFFMFFLKIAPLRLLPHHSFKLVNVTGVLQIAKSSDTVSEHTLFHLTDGIWHSWSLLLDRIFLGFCDTTCCGLPSLSLVSFLPFPLLVFHLKS